MIRWRDGIEVIGGVPAREVVQPSVWSSAVFVTAVGDAYRRYYNPVARSWGEWEAVPASLDAGEGTRLGYALKAGWMSVETAVATAWRHRAPDSTARARVVDPARAVDARNVAWNEPEDPEDPEGGGGMFEGEAWERLRWSCGLAECDGRYEISSHGRLRSPRGEVTRGFAAFSTRWASVKGAGLVNLLAAAGLVRSEVAIPPRVFNAYRSIAARVSVAKHAQRFRLSPKAAWQYYALAAVHVPDVHVYARDLVAKDVWRLLLSMRGEPVLGGRLTDLMAVVDRRLRREISFEELRFARVCAV